MRSRGQSVWLFLFFFFFLLLLLHVDASPQGSAVAFVFVVVCCSVPSAFCCRDCFRSLPLFLHHPDVCFASSEYFAGDFLAFCRFRWFNSLSESRRSIHPFSSIMYAFKKKNQPLLMSQRALTTLTTSSQLLAPPSETQG